MRTTLLVGAVLIALALFPMAASAATCWDYATQAEAQRAVRAYAHDLKLFFAFVGRQHKPVDVRKWEAPRAPAHPSPRPFESR